MTWYKLDGRHVAQRHCRWAHVPISMPIAIFTTRNELSSATNATKNNTNTTITITYKFI